MSVNLKVKSTPSIKKKKVTVLPLSIYQELFPDALNFLPLQQPAGPTEHINGDGWDL